MQQPFERPASIAQAAALLAAGPWAVLAGGTDLYPAHVGRSVAVPLLDITAIAELRGIRCDDSGWTIGATTRWTDVIRADLPPLLGALQAAAREVGGVQIQNAGTVAGNLCNASPAADGTPVLLALGASVVLRSERGERTLPLERFLVGNRQTARAADELVVAIRIPARSARARSVFAKLGGRRYLTIAVTTVALVVDSDSDDAIVAAGAAVGSCAAAARRLPALEARLVGTSLRSDLAALVEAADLAPLAPIDDLRGSAAYRLDATRTLLGRALRDIVAAAVS
ncbi:MAG TPA: FAD binding domain-containing protein [Caldimonas sp.]|jgi:CO/xanthine dehydrogenase FAD-binding subunit|nr:FAD binding domain-containing protein [Caldimonas sp.]HEX4233097.1 FAD binding domain-containing protein [Caldimonas sp.]